MQLEFSTGATGLRFPSSKVCGYDDDSLSPRPMTQRFIVPTLALLVSVFSVALSLYGMYAAREQKKLEALLAIDQYLHQPEMSAARAAIREGRAQPTIKDPNVRIVCSSFDFAGNLVRNGAIDLDLFMDYWQVPLRIIGETLEPIRSEKITEGVSVAEYYKDWFWLLDRSGAALTE
jgi:hypothetical protein